MAKTSETRFAALRWTSSCWKPIALSCAVPYRGKRCEPPYVKDISEVAAQVKGCSPEELAATTAPLRRAFSAAVITAIRRYWRLRPSQCLCQEFCHVAAREWALNDRFGAGNCAGGNYYRSVGWRRTICVSGSAIFKESSYFDSARQRRLPCHSNRFQAA